MGWLIDCRYRHSVWGGQGSDWLIDCGTDIQSEVGKGLIDWLWVQTFSPRWARTWLIDCGYRHSVRRGGRFWLIDCWYRLSAEVGKGLIDWLLVQTFSPRWARVWLIGCWSPRWARVWLIGCWYRGLARGGRGSDWLNVVTDVWATVSPRWIWVRVWVIDCWGSDWLSVESLIAWLFDCRGSDWFLVQTASPRRVRAWPSSLVLKPPTQSGSSSYREVNCWDSSKKLDSDIKA